MKQETPIIFLLQYSQCFRSYETENKTGLCNAIKPSQSAPSIVQILEMETCACLINHQECTLQAALQTLTAEKYAIKKPQGMQAVCSARPTREPTLQFQWKSWTICADLFELESRCGGSHFKRKGMYRKREKGWGKNCRFWEVLFEVQSAVTGLHSYYCGLRWNEKWKTAHAWQGFR